MGHSLTLDEIVHSFRKISHSLGERVRYFKEWYVAVPLTITSLGALTFLTYAIGNRMAEGLYEANVVSRFRAIENNLNIRDENDYIQRLSLWELNAAHVLDQVCVGLYNPDASIGLMDAQILGALDLVEKGIEKGCTQGLLEWGREAAFLKESGELLHRDSRIALFEELVDYRERFSVYHKGKSFGWIADNIAETNGKVKRYIEEHMTKIVQN